MVSEIGRRSYVSKYRPEGGIIINNTKNITEIANCVKDTDIVKE